MRQGKPEACRGSLVAIFLLVDRSRRFFGWACGILSCTLFELNANDGTLLSDGSLRQRRSKSGGWQNLTDTGLCKFNSWKSLNKAQTWLTSAPGPSAQADNEHAMWLTQLHGNQVTMPMKTI